MSTGITDPALCQRRAVTFARDAEELLAIENQWFAVAAFYAAYQLVRSALIVDPVFADLARLHAIDTSLQPEDRLAHVHAARRGKGHAAPGVNDLVQKLYPSIRVRYLRLHSASVAVRYEIGIGAYRSVDLMGDLVTVRSAVDAGLAA